MNVAAKLEDVEEEIGVIDKELVRLMAGLSVRREPLDEITALVQPVKRPEAVEREIRQRVTRKRQLERLRQDLCKVARAGVQEI